MEAELLNRFSLALIGPVYALAVLGVRSSQD